MSTAGEIKGTIQSHNTFVGEMIDKKKLFIAIDIKKNKFFVSPFLIEKIMALCDFSDVLFSIKEIAEAYKNRTYQDNPDLQKQIDEIALLFLVQEINLPLEEP